MKKASGRDSRPLEFLGGQLLIAMPNMRDPRFERSVLLMCVHDSERAMGVIVNKALGEVELGELLEQLDIDPREGVGGDPVHFGGPVATERGLVLHSLDYRLPATLALNESIGLTASREILVDVGGRSAKRPPPARFMVAVGHAGWGPGQLESELAANAWVHAAADPDLVFSDAPSSVWKRSLERLGVTGAMLSPEWSAPRSGRAPLH
jgi:putative transcriptional regulator